MGPQISELVGEVAIVVPAYNAERFLGDTLRAVSEQTIGSWRCVVVDDGSSDSTADIVRSFADTDQRFSLQSQSNQGVASARNHGARVSTGEYIMFLDADDVLVTDALERLRALLVTDADAPVAHGAATVIDHVGKPSDAGGNEQTYGRLRVCDSPPLVGRVNMVPDSDKTGFDSLAFRNPITTPGQVLIRRRAFDCTGGFDPSVQPAEDWDYWTRLAHHGPFAYLPREVIRYRKHADGASAQLSRMRTAELTVRHRLIERARVGDRSNEKLARLGLRRTEIQRAQERLSLALSHAWTDPTVSMRDLARAGSSLREVVRSFLPVRSSDSVGTADERHPLVMLVSTASNVGGMERVICGLALHLPACGYGVRTFVPQSERSDVLVAWCHDQGVIAEAEAAVLDAAASHSPKGAYALAKLIRRTDPRIVSLHYGDNFLSLWDVLGARMSGRRRCVVATINHPTPWTATNRRKRAMTALGGRLVHGITTISYATEEILQATPLPTERIHRIPCGIAVPRDLLTVTEARRRLGVPDDAFVIGCIARLVEHKRIDLLIEAVDTIDLAGSTLLIGGDGPLRQDLEIRAEAAQHADVRCLGRIEDINDLLAACDIFALPSELEGFGLVYVEAAVHGVPSVATRVGGIPDAVVDEETGILVDVGSVDQLHRAIVRLSMDEPLRRRLGGAARERARSELSDVTMVSRFADLFGELA